MAILQFPLDSERGALPEGFSIPTQSRVHTQPIDGLSCRYRTAYPVTLWPIEVASARLQPPPFPPALKAPARAEAALRLQLDCQAGLKFSELALDRLRFYLSGESQVIANLYEILFTHTTQVLFRSLDKDIKPESVVLTPEQAVFQVGFERDEGLLPYPKQSFPGYRLLTEFFAFREKFLFFDLGGFQRVRQAGFGQSLEVVFFLDRTQLSLEQSVEANTFRLGCSPIVNLFEQTAEPIPLTHARHEYRVLPDVANSSGMEVYSIDSVSSTDPTVNETTEYAPFYSYRHGGDRENARAFWYASRRPSLRENDNGSDVYLHLVDLDFNPRLPAKSVVVVRTTSLNRDLPDLLQRAGEDLYFELEQAAPVNRLQCLRSPTSTLRPPLRRGAHWRLISHLSLNHLSLSDPVAGREALQEILRLYDFSSSDTGRHVTAVSRQLIDGIMSVASRPVVGRTGGPTASGFCRGTEITIEFDEEKYVGTGVFLFASMLERFLGLYSSINSFSQLIAKTKQGEETIKKWPPRAGDLALL
jgi:type VI secretion system protein ImpG